MNLFGLLWLLACPLVLVGCGHDPAHEPQRPNILLLLLDDLGYNDLGIQSNDPSIPTPNMDQLARAGTRFTRFYTESTCTPSRAALLTGRYAARAGFRPIARGIPPEVTTLPEALRARGYATHHVGKWHLGTTVKEALPLAQGFDTSFGFLNQWSMRKPGPSHSLSYPTYYDPWLSQGDQPRREHKGHLTDLLADRTIELIESAERTRPWFIYHAFFAPHTPIEPARSYSEQFPDTPEGKFKALLSQLDHNVGRILDRLRETGQFDNTIIVLASDNGGTNAARDNNFPYFGKKATYFEGGIRVPLVIHWPERFAPGTTFDETVAIFDLYPTLLDMVSGRAGEGAGVATTLDGVSLVKAQQQKDLLERDLFWESYIFRHAVYGVLSTEDIRLFHQLSGADRLFNLAKHATGNPADALPTIDAEALVAEIRAKYEAWRRETRRVDTHWSESGPRGRGVLSGDNFQRAPGVSGYTFAIGVTLAHDVSNAPPALQIIAQQRGLLSITLDRESRISVALDGQVLRSAPIASPGCHAIVVSSFFHRQLSPRGLNNPRVIPLSLYVDGELADLKASRQAMPASQSLAEPTYIGQDREGQNQFAGLLSRPRIYNQAMVAKGDISFPGIEDIQALVCP